MNDEDIHFASWRSELGKDARDIVTASMTKCAAHQLMDFCLGCFTTYKRGMQVRETKFVPRLGWFDQSIGA
jgi:hypothetical protein